MIVEKICQYCGKTYLGKKSSKYCGRECSYKALSEKFSGSGHPQYKGGKTRKVCKNCGKVFFLFPCEAHKQFCCSECYWEWKKGKPLIEKVVIICEQCGCEFEVVPSAVRRFCTHECYWQWLSENNVGENHPTWLGEETFVCEQCGKEFTELRSRRDRRFCSLECYGKWRTDNLSGENSPAWLGGASFEPYTPEFNNGFKTIVRERDDYTCAVCGKKGKCVHHIDYDKENTTLENCITLCRSCHGKTNTDRAKWQYILTEIQTRRLENA